MAQQAAKKSVNNQAAAKSSTAVNTMKPAVQAEKVLNISQDSIGEVLREVKDISRMAHECIGVCTKAFSAGIESGNAATQVLREVGNQLTENANRAFSENSELFSEAMACRSAQELSHWHAKFWQQTMDRYFDEATGLCEVLFNGCAEAMESLQEQAAIASGRLNKLIKV